MKLETRSRPLTNAPMPTHTPHGQDDGFTRLVTLIVEAVAAIVAIARALRRSG